ncbi:MAG: type II toxin-antitoxin system VapC family toxin [Pyrinomonadaceae bacterium]
MIVSDTNILAYLILESDRTDDAVALRRKDPEWAVPPIWRSEFCNLLATAMRNSSMDIEDAVLAFNVATRLVGNSEINIAARRVLELAESSGCTAYDCEFVSLAERLGVPLITTDKKVIAAFPDIAVSMEKFLGN